MKWIAPVLLLAAACTQAAGDPYAAITAGTPRAVPADYLGMHIHRLVIGPADAGRMRTPWPDLRLGALRLWDARTRWADIAPKAGDWRFERLDEYVEAARSRGVKVRYVLGSTPQWASARPLEPCPYGFGCAAEPVRMAHWEEYVRRVAARYKGRIAEYELWNEPRFSDFARDRGTQGFYSGSVADMVEMARIARQVLNEVDPQARLLTPGFVNGPDRLALFLQAGGKQYVDGVAYHFYSADARRFADQVRQVREVMRAQGVAHLPLYNTETGVEAWPADKPRPLGETVRTRAQAAAHVAQFMVLGAAAGLASYDFYSWDGDHYGAVDRGAVQPVHAALGRVVAWLDGAVFNGCQDQGGWVACRGERAGQPFVVAWSDAGASARIAAPGGHRFAGAERALEAARFSLRADGTLNAVLDTVPVLFRFEPDASRS